MKFNPDDPKWSAYVLGEMPAGERAALERELESSPEAQDFVEELRLTAELMQDELRAAATFGLTSEQRDTVRTAAEPRKRWFAFPAIWAAGAVAASLVMGFVLWSTLRQAPERMAVRMERDQSAAAVSQAPIESNVPYVESPAPAGEDRAPRPASKAQASVLSDSTTGVHLTGIVKDASSAVIPGVTVRAVDSASGASATTVTSEAGTYEFPDLPPGTYALTADLPGFQTARLENIVVGKKQEERRDIDLQVATVAQAVDVSAKLESTQTQTSASLRETLIDIGNGDGAFRAQGEGSRSGALSGVLGGVLRAQDSAAAAPPPPAPLRFSAPSAIAPSAPAFDRIVTFPANNNELYDRITDNGFIAVSQQPLATFSSDVDTASYANVRRFITQNQWPPRDAVRTEELINYFSYAYPQSVGPHPITAQLEVAAAPWAPQHRLVRIGLKAKDVQMGRKPSNLVFLIDVSGSMGPAERLPLLKSGLRMLVDKLTEDDTVSIVVYAGASGIALQPTSGEKKEVIHRAIENLQSRGSTNGASGIRLAYDLAVSNFIRGGVNRVILATDGDFNVGVTSQSDLVQLIEEKAKSDVFLTVLGFGQGNLKDSTLERLADKGNGHYAYIDSLNEARKVLVEEMGATLVTVAKDVKLQVEFNPLQAGAYRLIGYENRALRSEDFNNDAKDAGDMGAGHTVTALFEVAPRGVNVEAASVDSLRYQRQPTPAAALPDGPASKELLNVKIRYKDPEGTESQLVEIPLIDRGTTFSNASEDFRFAAAVAGFGMILRDSPHKGSATLDWVVTTATKSRGADVHGYREEFVRLVQRAMQIRVR